MLHTVPCGLEGLDDSTPAESEDHIIQVLGLIENPPRVIRPSVPVYVYIGTLLGIFILHIYQSTYNT